MIVPWRRVARAGAEALGLALRAMLVVALVGGLWPFTAVAGVSAGPAAPGMSAFAMTEHSVHPGMTQAAANLPTPDRESGMSRLGNGVLDVIVCKMDCIGVVIEPGPSRPSGPAFRFMARLRLGKVQLAPSRAELPPHRPPKATV
jgi:hypothetical protein